MPDRLRSVRHVTSPNTESLDALRLTPITIRPFSLRAGPPKVFTAYDTASELPTQADVGGKELDQAHTSAHRLLWVRDADDIEDEVELRMSMLWK